MTRAEDYQYGVKQVGEKVTGKMFTSLLMKGLPMEFDTFVTLVKFSKEEEEKGIEELKKDLINFASDRKNISKWNQSESALFLVRGSLLLIVSSANV